MKAVVFPGQGSQYTGMGLSLNDNFSRARELFQAIDRAAGYDLSRKCFQGPEEDLKNTRIQQLAILAVSLASYVCLPEAEKKDIAFFSGLSLGEYSCLYAAEVLSLEDLVLLVKERAEAMEEAAALNPSTMFAVLGMDQEALSAQLSLGFHFANINAPGQIVVSLAKDKTDEIRRGLEASGAKVIELQVSGGFHSPFMGSARTRLKKMIDSLSFSRAGIPIVSNVTGRGHVAPDEIRENLLDQLVSPVLWKSCVEFMVKGGVDLFYETGPKQVLKGLIRKISRQVTVRNFEKFEDFS